MLDWHSYYFLGYAAMFTMASVTLYFANKTLLAQGEKHHPKLLKFSNWGAVGGYVSAILVSMGYNVN